MQTSDPSMDQTARISLHHPIMSKSTSKDKHPARANKVSAHARHTSRKQNQILPHPATPASTSSAAVKRYLGNPTSACKREFAPREGKMTFARNFAAFLPPLSHLLRKPRPLAQLPNPAIRRRGRIAGPGRRAHRPRAAPPRACGVNHPTRGH